ncbi:hypothetical protein OPQ81_005325 [Rhizoctonia solani]|nr:hypothetical protein OPQ81_005325 [Rhizoctonia solani]
MFSKSVVSVLVTGMLITGCANSLLTKWQDNMCVANCDPGDKLPPRYFEQPVWQTLNMFIGEMLCFLPIIYVKLSQPKKVQPLLIEEDDREDEAHKGSAVPLTGWKVCWLWLPALCDLTATTLMGVGLIHIPVSIYQMTRGALVLWVGVLSVILLRTRLFAFQWFSLLTVMFGVGLVGLSGSLIRAGDGSEFTSNAAEADPELIMGMTLVLLAQLFAATQFVVEDKIMRTYSIEAMLAVGWEGFFGTFTILLALPVIAYFPSIPLTIIPPFIGAHFSGAACFLLNYVLYRIVQLFRVMLGWEQIKWPGSVPQFIGFGLLVYGTFLFNGLVEPPSFMRPAQSAEVPLIDPATTDSDPLSGVSVPEGERRPLLADQASA